jgi:hypothetical protein
MIVTSHRKLSDYAKRVNDLDLGDWVVHLITRKRGMVSEIEPHNGFVTVDYLDGSHDCLPRPAFRKVRGKRKDMGHDFDTRKR